MGRNRKKASQRDTTAQLAPPSENEPTTQLMECPSNSVDDGLLSDITSFHWLLGVMVLFRIGSCTHIVINDCDEVYNYWEPLHLFLHGEGFETWEYSPVYAIRSYFYICLHYVPAWIFSFSLFSKTTVFLVVRFCLAMLCITGEWYAYDAIAKKLSIRCARFFIFFSAASSGVYLSSSSFLPSSFCMTITFFTIGAFLKQNWSLGIFCVAFSTLVGWPFSAILGLPFVLHMLVLNDLKSEFILSAFFSGFGIGLVQFLVDTYFFGKPVVASLNIVLYNVLSGPGPALYGEEPFSFYIKNLFLNWNILIFVIAFGIPLAVWRMWVLWRTDSLGDSIKRNSDTFLLTATPLLWMMIFGLQSHKEERFLFPIYPFISLLAAVVYDCIHVNVFSRLTGNWRKTLAISFLVCYSLLSLSRVIAIRVNYEAHSQIYSDLENEIGVGSLVRGADPSEVQVCVGKEWHRFPSSFFVPDYDRHGRRVRMEFVRSEFRGLLPKPFKSVLHLIDSTRHEPMGMNNMNKEETSRYVSLDTCDYFIDVDMPATEMEPNLGEMEIEWKLIASRPFINLSAPAKYFGLLRAFHIPYFSRKENVMTTYSLYRNNAK